MIQISQPKKMETYIPYGKQSINQQDIDEVVAVLRSDWLTQGPMIELFEQTVANYCGVKFAVAVSSATAGLHLACIALGLEPGNSLWTSPITFVASANCGLYCGAEVDFVDIDLNTYNMSIESLEEKLIQSKKEGKLPKILVPVHLAGQSCDMTQIQQLSQEYGFYILEDASHAIGGEYLGSPVGCCKFSDMAVFSFHPVKIITTGEGGIVVTNQRNIYEKLIRLRSHGITRKPELMKEKSHGPWYYEQLELGFNYRITDIQAALGVSQLKRLDKFIEQRRNLAERYNELLAELPIITPIEYLNVKSSWHLYIIRLRLDKIHKTHRQVFEEMRNAGIYVNLHYIPVYCHPYFKGLNYVGNKCINAEQYYSTAISLPIYPDLTITEQNYVAASLQAIIAS